MPNITVSLDNETYTQARVWAAQRGYSLSAVVRYLLHSLPKFPVAKKTPPSRSAILRKSDG